MPSDSPKKPSRIQLKNRKKILDAALVVFSAHGFRGATLDQIAEAAGLSKPNLLYYFDGKDDIHRTLLNALLEVWLAPLVEMNESDDPLEALMRYVHRKLEMSWEMPRESRLFAGEVLQGAPRMITDLKSGLKPLFDEKCALIEGWVARGALAEVDPAQLIISIWAVTQHYADFEAQVAVLIPGKTRARSKARAHVDQMFRGLLTP